MGGEPERAQKVEWSGVEWNASFYYLAMSSARGQHAVVRSDICEKLFVLTGCEKNVVSSFAAFKQCHIVSTFQSQKKDVVS